MGTGWSKSAPQQAAHFATPAQSVDWAAVAEAPWRSERARELDKYGGLLRPAVARGQSMTAKLQFLQEQVGAQATEIQHEFSKTTADVKAQMEAGSLTHRLGAAAAAAERPPGQPLLRARTTTNSFFSGASMIGRRPQLLGEPMRPKVDAAAWRVRTHNARRRAMTVIMVANRFLAGGRNPKRLRRVDSFSYYIPAVLHNDMKRFVAAGRRYDDALERDAAALAAEAAEAERQAAAAAAAAAAAEHPPGALQPHKPAAHKNKTYRPMLLGSGGGGMAAKKLTHAAFSSTTASQPRGGSSTAAASTCQSAAPSVAGDDTAAALQDLTTRARSSTSGLNPACGGVEAPRPAAKSVPHPPALASPGFAGPQMPALRAPAPGPGQGGSVSAGASLVSSPTVAGGGAGLLPPLPQPSSSSSATGRRAMLLEKLPPEPYQQAAAAAAAATQPVLLPDVLAERGGGGRSLQGIELPPIGQAPEAASGPSFQLSTTSKYGYTSAASRALMPKRIKEVMVERQARRSESGISAAAAQAALEQHTQLDSRLSTGVNGDTAASSFTSQDAPDLASRAPSGATHHFPHPPQAPPPVHHQPPHHSGGHALAPRRSGHASFSSPGTAPALNPEAALAHNVAALHKAIGPLLPPEAGAGPDAENGEHASASQQQAPAGIQTRPSGGFGQHVDGLRRRSVVMSLDDEVVAEMEKLAEDLHAAREQMRKDEVAAAQRQLEEEWEAELRQQQAPEEASAESCVKLLSMYVNRGNAAWASSRQWAPPNLWDRPKQEEWMGQDDWNVWKAKTAYCLKAGGLAVQIFAAGCSVTYPHRTYDLWMSDPWELMIAHRPVQVKDRIPGVTMGVRVLANLAAAVEAFGGKEALAKLTVVLHLSEEQFEKHLPVLRFQNFGGLDPKNLVLFVQRKRPGYKFDANLQRFVPLSSGHVESCGTGYSLMQLNWVGEAFLLNREGQPTRLMGTALEHLKSRGAEWLISHSASDMGLLTRESCMDLVLLPFLLNAHKAAGVTCMTQVVREDSLGAAARSNGSIMMGRVAQSSGRAMTLSQLASGHPAAGLQLVMELRATELHSGSMKDVVKVGKVGGTHYLLGVDRHVVHLTELAAVLVSPDVVRPKLTLHEGQLHVKLDFSDLTCHESIRTLAVRTRQCPQMLLTPADLDELLPLVRYQDQLAHFRKVIGSRRTTSIDLNLLPRGPMGSLVMSGAGSPVLRGLASPISPGSFMNGAAGPGSGLLDSLGSQSGSQSPVPRPGVGGAGGAGGARVVNNIVVFVSGNNVAHLAVEAALSVAKPGRDVIHLVTVVAGYMYVDGGQALLDSHYASVARELVEARQEVLVMDKEDPQLISTMEQYVLAAHAEMVVMATKALNTTQLQSSTILGSVTLAAIKRLQVPVMVVNANSLNVQEALKHHHLRAMALVDRHAAPLVHYLADRVLQAPRGDSLVLCRVEDPTGVVKINAAGSTPGQKTAGLKLNHREQQAHMMQRQLAAMNQTATMAGLPAPLTLSLEDERVEDITRIINKEGVHLLACLLPAVVSKVPEQLIHLIHSCRSAVLVFKQQQQQQQQQRR